MQFSHQESLDISSLGLIRQGRPGYALDHHNNIVCRYAAGCAAAQLLPPEVDREAIDSSPGSQAADGPVVAAHLRAAGHDPHFAYKLQVVHDASVEELQGEGAVDTLQWRSEWLRGLRALAEDRGLDLSKVEQAAREAGWEVA